MLNKVFSSRNNSLKKIDILLIVFLVIQPIFDLKIFYNSISTLIRVVIIFGFFSYYFLTSKNKKKYLLIIYPLVIGIYFIFHHINALGFKSLVPGNFNYSIIKEGLYFIKMLCPFLLIYCLYKANFSKEVILNIIKILVLIISSIIVISNLFVFSYGSYSDQTIKANFLSWFAANEYSYQDLASKGLFEYANQIGAILLMFLPFSLYSFLKNRKNIDLFVLIINIFSMFLLGTKVSVLGVFMVFFYTVITYMFYAKIISKQKLVFTPFISSAVVILIYILILFNNPIFIRINEDKVIATSSTSVLTVEPSTNDVKVSNVVENTTVSNQSNASNFNNLENLYTDLQIKKEFITQNYPYEYDSEFWMKIFDEPLSNRVNYRFIEQSMIERIVEINNNKYDKYLGITNTRLQNVFNIERDFVVQYYALGIIGLILVFLPYLLLLLCYFYKGISTKLHCLNVENLLAFISILITFGVSYLSGNLLNSLSFTLYFALLFIPLLHTDTHN